MMGPSNLTGVADPQVRQIFLNAFSVFGSALVARKGLQEFQYTGFVMGWLHAFGGRQRPARLICD